jgi:hypothetical protein
MTSLKLPCLSCTSPQAADVRHLLGSGALDEASNRTPNGLPLVCCRVTFAGVAPAGGTVYAVPVSEP